MKTVEYKYINKRNSNKFLIVHRSECGHYLVKQVMIFENGVINKTGSGTFHRCKKADLVNLLSDYSLYINLLIDERWV